MKYLEVSVIYISILALVAITGYTLKDSPKATENIKQHLIQKGMR